MNESSFNSLYSTYFVPEAQILLQLISDKYGNDRVKFNNDDRTLKSIYEKYEYYRKKLKDSIYGKGNNNDNRLDRHKIASCIVAAVCHTEPFDDLQPMQTKKYLLWTMNHNFAFVCGVKLLEIWKVSDKSESDDDLKIHLIRYPDVNNEHHEPYIGNRDIHPQGYPAHIINYLHRYYPNQCSLTHIGKELKLMSHIFFFIECYNNKLQEVEKFCSYKQ